MQIFFDKNFLWQLYKALHIKSFQRTAQVKRSGLRNQHKRKKTCVWWPFKTKKKVFKEILPSEVIIALLAFLAFLDVKSEAILREKNLQWSLANCLRLGRKAVKTA